MARLISLLILLPFLAACAGPAARPCSAVAADYLTQLDSLLSEWQDATAVADATARIALSAPVTRLQDIRRRTAALQVPTCTAVYHDLQLASMDHIITAYLDFMQQRSEYGVAATLDEAVADLELATTARRRIAQGAPNQAMVIHEVRYRVAGERVGAAFIDAAGQRQVALATVAYWEQDIRSLAGETVGVEARLEAGSQVACDIYVDGEQVISQTGTEQAACTWLIE